MLLQSTQHITKYTLQQYSGRLVFKQNLIGTRGTKYAKKTSPRWPLHHQGQQPEPVIQGMMDPCFHVVIAKFWPYHLNVSAEIETRQTRQCFSNLLLSNFGEPTFSEKKVQKLSLGLYLFKRYTFVPKGCILVP